MGEGEDRIEERRNNRELMCRLAEHSLGAMSHFSRRYSKQSSLSLNLKTTNPYKEKSNLPIFNINLAHVN